MSDGRVDDIVVSATGADAGSHDSLATLPTTSPVRGKEPSLGIFFSFPTIVCCRDRAKKTLFSMNGVSRTHAGMITKGCQNAYNIAKIWNGMG